MLRGSYNRNSVLVRVMHECVASYEGRNCSSSIVGAKVAESVGTCRVSTRYILGYVTGLAAMTRRLKLSSVR